MVEEITITSKTGRGSVTMGTRDFAGYWLGTVDWGQVEGTHKTYRYQDQMGESIVSTAVGSRELSIEGWVIETGENSLGQRCDFLNRFFSPVEDYTLTYQGWKIDFRPISSVVYSRQRRSDNGVLRKFLLQGTCPFPFFVPEEAVAVPFDFSTKQFRFPTGFGRTAPVVFATTEQLYNTRISNPGGFSAGVTIRIDFAGPVTNPRIRDLRTNQLIGVNRTFTSGERLTMVTVPGQKAMRLRRADQTEENVIKNRHVETVWLQLAPGSNVWALDCDDLQQRANMNVQVFFSPLYLEVE